MIWMLVLSSQDYKMAYYKNAELHRLANYITLLRARIAWSLASRPVYGPSIYQRIHKVIFQIRKLSRASNPLATKRFV